MQKILPYKDPVKQKQYFKKWHKKNDNRIQRARKTKRLKMLDRIQLELGCNHCGYNKNPRA